MLVQRTVCLVAAPLALVLASCGGCKSDTPPAKPSATAPAVSTPPSPPGPPALPAPLNQPAEKRTPQPEHGERVETVTQNYPSGAKQTERQEIVSADGTRMRHGPIKVWHESGGLMLEGIYNLGAIDGVWTYYYPSGKLERHAQFVDGKQEGIWTEWWENGQKRSEGLYAAGKAEGPWHFWFENGQSQAEGEYKNGLREGAWKFFDPQGNVGADTGMYSAGKKVQ
jgi:hypothetical protein